VRLLQAHRASAPHRGRRYSLCLSDNLGAGVFSLLASPMRPPALAKQVSLRAITLSWCGGTRAPSHLLVTIARSPRFSAILGNAWNIDSPVRVDARVSMERSLILPAPFVSINLHAMKFRDVPATARLCRCCTVVRHGSQKVLWLGGSMARGAEI